jgi:hypothetical protein
MARSTQRRLGFERSRRPWQRNTPRNGGHVIVDSAIAGDKIFNRFPDAASQEENLISIEAIVNAFTFLYGQPARGWSFEVDVRTSCEKWVNGDAGAQFPHSEYRNSPRTFGSAIPTKMPTKQTAGVDFCLCFQCIAKIFARNPESNQWLKLLLSLSFLPWCPWPEPF